MSVWYRRPRLLRLTPRWWRSNSGAWIWPSSMRMPVGDGGGGHVEFFGGADKAFMLGGCIEEAEAFERWQALHGVGLDVPGTTT